jgi:hypothetical protein
VAAPLPERVPLSVPDSVPLSVPERELVGDSDGVAEGVPEALAVIEAVLEGVGAPGVFVGDGVMEGVTEGVVVAVLLGVRLYEKVGSVNVRGSGTAATPRNSAPEPPHVCALRLKPPAQAWYAVHVPVAKAVLGVWIAHSRLRPTKIR